jgi:hypothetical protein
MKRPQRLEHARAKWGQNPPESVKRLIRHYANWFKIDLVCAAVEVQLLGHPVDADYLEQLRANRARPKKKQSVAVSTEIDQDEYRAFIMGYTPAGFAYGVTWEEWDQMNAEDEVSRPVDGRLPIECPDLHPPEDGAELRRILREKHPTFT